MIPLGQNIAYLSIVQTTRDVLCTLLTNFVELVALVLVELGREIRAEGHDEESDAQQGVHQIQHGQEPEMSGTYS